MRKYGTVGVFMGGTSSERAVSMVGGQRILATLKEMKIPAIGIDIAEPFWDVLSQIDRALIIVHGYGGEDGALQGVLELQNIPYSGSSILGSALSLDKIQAKRIWQYMGITTPPARPVQTAAECIDFIHQWGYPVAIKPIYNGSSLGIHKITAEQEIASALTEIKALNSGLMIERWVSGREYTVPLLNDEVLPPVFIDTKEAYVTFDVKYSRVNTKYVCPCGLSPLEEDKLKQVASTAFTAVSASGWGRVDIIRDYQGRYNVLEVNTTPGITPNSLFPYSYHSTGRSFTDFVMALLKQTLSKQHSPNLQHASLSA